MNDRSGNGTGSFEVKIRTNTEKFTNMIIARFRESRYLVREGEVFIKDEAEVASRVSSIVRCADFLSNLTILTAETLSYFAVKTA